MKRRTQWSRTQIRIGVGIGILLTAILMRYGVLQSDDTLPVKALRTPLSITQLRNDVAFLLSTLEAVHPNLYAYTPQREIAARKEALEASLTRPMTRLEFYPELARFVAAFGDGHTYDRFPEEEWKHFLETDGRVFPLELAYDEGRLRVTANHDATPDIEPGDELLTINGESAAALFDRFKQERSGSERFRINRSEQMFARKLWAHGFSAPFVVEYRRTAQAPPRRAELLGVTQDLTVREASGLKTVPYRFELLQDGIGYLDFRSMHRLDEEAFRAFLHETFAGIKVRNDRGLVIDLRRNGGGNSRRGDELLRYLTDQPYRLSGGMSWKVSRQYQSHVRTRYPRLLRWLPYLQPGYNRYMWARPGSIITDTASAAPPREATPLRYDGPVVFLIGPATFSSAVALANAVEDYGLAMLIGEETGGIPNEYGEVYLFRLPHSRLEVGVSSKQFIRANGDPHDRNGVLPDIAVRQRSEDSAAGVDTVLEAAKAWLLEASSSAPTTAKTVQ